MNITEAIGLLESANIASAVKVLEKLIGDPLIDTNTGRARRTATYAFKDGTRIRLYVTSDQKLAYKITPKYGPYLISPSFDSMMPLVKHLKTIGMTKYRGISYGTNRKSPQPVSRPKPRRAKPAVKKRKPTIRRRRPRF
jgi:hypothetical protein